MKTKNVKSFETLKGAMIEKNSTKNILGGTGEIDDITLIEVINGDIDDATTGSGMASGKRQHRPV